MTAQARALPTVPRETWAEHRNFPEQVLLLGSHENFRRISAHLIEHAEHDLAWADVLYRRWIAAMRSHESYEEFKLYPFLNSRWGASCDQAAKGHRILHDLDKAVREAFSQARDSPSDETNAALRLALQEHDDALRDHLSVEEDLVIPLLLELSREEFEAYCAS